MLSMTTLRPQQGEHYYSQENYYAEGQAQQNSEWFGQGAARLGLSGVIADVQTFNRLLYGEGPEGQQLRHKPFNPKTAERAGVDLTFSAPKSVSLAALVKGDLQLVEAHRQAVRQVLTLIEQRYAHCRIQGRVTQTDNLSVALWHHDTSRELDPQLHTHCVVLNGTQGPDGRWRSRGDEALYYNKMLLGQLYRHELAFACQQLGYALEIQADGTFELAGYERWQIEAFSKREAQIRQHLAAAGLPYNTENCTWAKFVTRQAKQSGLDRQQLRDFWQREAESYGVVHPEARADLEPGSGLGGGDLAARVTAAVAHCEERRAVFGIEALEQFITATPTGHSLTEIEGAIARHPHLIAQQGLFTTALARQREQRTIALMRAGWGQCSPLAEGVDIQVRLTPGQRQALALTLASRDRVLGWQGVPGAGKSTTLAALVRLAQQQGVSVQGLAPSAEAAQVLQCEIGIPTETVDGFLLHPPSESVTKSGRQLLIVDEAGLLSAKQAEQLLRWSQQHQDQLLLVGDCKQLSAVEAGAPFRSLQQHGMAVAQLQDFLRQRDPALNRAVRLMAQGFGADALELLAAADRIREVAGLEERAAALAAAYLNLSPQERAQTLVLAGTHRERQLITAAIRQGLVAEGRLGQTAVTVRTLRRRDLTAAQRQQVHAYQPGDLLYHQRRYQAVIAVEPEALLVATKPGVIERLDPSSLARVEVYQPQELEVRVGDRLRWLRNERQWGRRNGQVFTVTEIDPQARRLVLQSETGAQQLLSLAQRHPADDALVSTVHASQGKTEERVLLSVGTDPTVAQESLYVAISRAKSNLMAFVENFEDVLERSQISRTQPNPSDLLQSDLGRLGNGNESQPVMTFPCIFKGER